MLATLAPHDILPAAWGPKWELLSTEYPWALLLGAGLFGAILGSFVNAAGYRLPRGISLITRARSFCPKCEHDLAWYDNVPILSYLLLRGRCRYCSGAIPLRYLVTEVVCALLMALVVHTTLVLNPGYGLGETLIFTLLVICMMILTVSDLETGYVPDQTVLPLAAVGLVTAPFMPDLHFARMDIISYPGMAAAALPWAAAGDSFLDALLGALAGGGVTWFAGACAELWLKKPAMGGGDVKLMAAVGAVLGWKAAYLAFFLSPFIGLAVIVPTLFFRKAEMQYELPGEEPPDDRKLYDNHRLTLIGLVCLGLHAAVVCLVYVCHEFYEVWKYSPLAFGMTYAGMMILFDSIRRRTVREKGRWLALDIVTDARGRASERIKGAIPFGPFLALAAIAVMIYQPVLLNHMYKVYIGGQAPGYPHQVPFF